MLRRLCETLSAPSVYGSAEAAVPDAMAPQLKAIQTRADAYTLTLGHPEVDPVRLEELGYDPKHTLRIPVQLRKCTSSVRPMGSKMMGKAGVREEREKERKFLDQLVKAKAGKGKGQDDDLMIVDDDEADGDDDHDLGPTGAGYLNRDSIYYYTNAETSNGSGGQGKKRKRVEGDEEGEDEVEEEEAPRRQAQKEDLIKAYKYGATLVPVDDMDEEELRMKFSQCLEIIGFVKTSDVRLPRLLHTRFASLFDSRRFPATTFSTMSATCTPTKTKPRLSSSSPPSSMRWSRPAAQHCVASSPSTRQQNPGWSS